MKNTLYNILTFMFFILALPVLADEWAVVGEMPSPVYNGKAIVYNEKIYIIGGFSSFTRLPSDTIQVYDPRDNTWSIAGTMRAPRAAFIADTYDNSILIAGGVSDNTDQIGSVLSWDLINKEAGSIAVNDTVGRISAVGGIYKNSLYVFGGYTGLEADTTLSYILEYNLSSRALYAFNEPYDYNYSTPQVPFQQMAARIDDNYYIFGGIYFVPTKKVFVFNTISKEYERIGLDLQKARAGGVAVKGLDESIYLIGGFNESTAAMREITVFSVDHYDGSSGYSLANIAGYLHYGRSQCMAVNYLDSLIYVFGGIDMNNEVVPHIEKMSFYKEATDVDGEKSVKSYVLHQNYPNPFNAGTRIVFELDKSGPVRLAIYDINGRLVRLLTDKILNAGKHEMFWDGTDGQNIQVSSGIYFYQLSGNDKNEMKKMVMVK